MNTIQEMVLRYFEVGGIVIAALGAVLFGWMQYQINRRMKDLNDYVAVSIVANSTSQLSLLNVGRINLYLHKWEVGQINENFDKPILIPSINASSLSIYVADLQHGKIPIKLYLTDERGDKYVSTGEFTIDLIPPISLPIPQPSQATGPIMSTPPQTPRITMPNYRVVSFKTEKNDWNL